MSRPQDDLLSYPVATAPDPGQAIAIAPGVLWIRLALPFRLDHVNVWALDGGEEGWTLIDTGLSDGRTRAAWEALLAGPLGGQPVRRIVATHFHPDHIGLAGWLVERTGAEFALSLTEWLYASLLSNGGTRASDETITAFYQRAGVDPEIRQSLLVRRNAYSKAVPAVPATMTRLRAGDRLRIGAADWQVIVGAGHTPEPVSLYDPSSHILISGDQVLPAISPNISVWPSEPEADPLADYLDTFDPLFALPEDTLVLPSHGLAFRGLHARLDWLRTHHAERLDEIAAMCAEEKTAAEVAALLFRRDLDPHQMVFAMGEAIAHLNRLLRRGTLTRRLDAHGVHRYRRTS